MPKNGSPQDDAADTTGDILEAWRSGAFAIVGGLENLIRNSRERNDAAENAHFGAGARHAVDDAG